MKTVLITGASRGIGLAAASKFYNEGYMVVMNARGAEALEASAEEIRCCGTGCGSAERLFTCAGDIGDIETAWRMIGTLAEGLKASGEEMHVDVLVNNAGIALISLLQDTTPVQWDELIRANLTSVYNTCHEAVPHMVRAQAGHIVNVSSMWGTVGASMEVAYSAAKGGVNAFTRALAKELAPSHIAVNAIACGVIDTTMNDHLDAEEKAELAENIPIGRFGTPEEVADLIFILAESGEYLTGQVIGLDGAYI